MISPTTAILHTSSGYENDASEYDEEQDQSEDSDNLPFTPTTIILSPRNTNNADGTADDGSDIQFLCHNVAELAVRVEAFFKVQEDAYAEQTRTGQVMSGECVAMFMQQSNDFRKCVHSISAAMLNHTMDINEQHAAEMVRCFDEVKQRIHETETASPLLVNSDSNGGSGNEGGSDRGGDVGSGDSNSDSETNFGSGTLNVSQFDMGLTSDDESPTKNEDMQHKLNQANDYATELEDKMNAQEQEFQIKMQALREEISKMKNAAAKDTDATDTNENETDADETDSNERKVAEVIKMQACVRRFIGQRFANELRRTKNDVEHMTRVIVAAANATATTIDTAQLRSDLVLFMSMSGDSNIEDVRKNENVVNRLVAFLHALYGRSLEERQNNDTALIAKFRDISIGDIGAVLAFWQNCDDGHGTSTDVSNLIQLCGRQNLLRMFLLVQLKAGFNFFNYIFVLLDRHGDFLKVLFAKKKDGELILPDLNGGETHEKMIDYLIRKRFDTDAIMLSDVAKAQIKAVTTVKDLGIQCRQFTTIKAVRQNIAKLVKEKDIVTLKQELEKLRGGDTYTQLFQTVVCGGGSSFVINNWTASSHVWKILDAKGDYYSSTKSTIRLNTLNGFLHWMNLHPDNLKQMKPLLYYQSAYSNLCKKM